MPYQFHEWEEEPEPLAASSRGGSPPLKTVGIGVLDPPVPPRRPPGPLAALPGSFFMRVVAGVLLCGLVFATLLLLFWKR